MSGEGSAEELGILQRHGQGCVERLRGLEDPILPLSAPTGVQLTATSPTLLCGIGDLKLCVHIFSAKLAPNSQKCCGNQQMARKGTPRSSKFIADSSLAGNKARGKRVTQSNTGHRPSAEIIHQGVLRGARIQCMVHS